MNNVPIIGKLLSVMALFGLFVVGATVFATGKMRTIDDTYSDLTDKQGVAGIAITRSSRSMWSIRSEISELMVANTDGEKDKVTVALSAYRADFIKNIDSATSILPDHAAQFAELKQRTLAAIDKTCEKSIKLGSVATSMESIAASQIVYLNECAPVFIGIAADFKKATDDVVAETKVINDATSDVVNATIKTTWAVILGGLVIVMIGGFLAMRAWVSSPIIDLAMRMNGLARGDLDVTITGESRKDEIGTIARVAKVFQQTGHEKLRLEADALSSGRLTEQERARTGAHLAEAAAQQSHVVTLVASGLSRLSDGDLAHRIDEAFPAEYEKLRSDFNGAMAKLQNTMKTVSASASAIRSGTGEISTASDDLSRRTEQQAASLEETAAALDEITATVRRTAEGSNHARSVVGKAKVNAQHSGQVVRQAVEAMSGIERSSREIGQIIGVIDEIAFQTNLLALNAGVEAARAGDAGRGFAVVASEVRALAQRSAEAAKEIKGLISTSGQLVGQGVTYVGQTGEALDRIVAQVAEIDGIVGEIAASASEQATGLDQVNTAVNQMDQVTQQNAAMVEESTAASHALSRETGELMRLMSGFRLGGNDDEARRAPASMAQFARRPASTPVPALRTTGRGGAARASAPVADADWTEF